MHFKSASRIAAAFLSFLSFLALSPALAQAPSPTRAPAAAPTPSPPSPLTSGAPLDPRLPVVGIGSFSVPYVDGATGARGTATVTLTGRQIVPKADHAFGVSEDAAIAAAASAGPPVSVRYVLEIVFRRADTDRKTAIGLVRVGEDDVATMASAAPGGRSLKLGGSRYYFPPDAMVSLRRGAKSCATWISDCRAWAKMNVIAAALPPHYGEPIVRESEEERSASYSETPFGGFESVGGGSGVGSRTRALPELKYHGPVHVNAYTRKDGTQVREHTRSAPGTKRH